MRMRIATLTGAALLVLVVAVGVSAANFTPGLLVQASGVTTFAACTADNVGGQSGTTFLNSEVEPWVDFNPTDGGNVVGIWQQDRWSNGGARGLVAGVSFDAGASWQSVAIPKVTVCSGGDYQRATDPWVSFGPNGSFTSLPCLSTTSLRRSRRSTSTMHCWPASPRTVA